MRTKTFVANREMMKYIVAFAVPVAFAFATLSAQAQTIETDYPQVVASGPVTAAPAPEQVATEGPSYILQSNSRGPRVNPAYADNDKHSLTRSEVEAKAQVRVQDFQWRAPDTKR